MNIVLIGMPGAGKSTLGVLLAKTLGMDYVDTDILIQQQEGRLLQDIIDNDGIEKFMQIEERIIAALNVQNCVIATGGSVIFSEKAVQKLKQGGKMVYLQLPYEEIEKRLRNITTRGIVIKQGESLKDIHDVRVPLYQKYADLIVDCSGQDIEDCVNEIVEQLRASTA